MSTIQSIPATSPIRIIALTGKAGSGKSTFADYFVEKGFVKLSFATPLKEDMAYIQSKYGFKQEKDRPLLQWLGCHYRKTGLDQNIEDPIISKMRMAIKDNSKFNIVIDDLRLPIEHQFLKTIGAECFRVCGREHDSKNMSGGCKQHITEIGLDDTCFDLIVNDGTLKDFYTKFQLIFF